MPSPLDRILIVESDPAISDIVGRQALQSAGYQIVIVNDVNSAIGKAARWAPDLIIASLSLPGLTVKDLLVALTSQGVSTPIIILAPRGTEASLIQTFRLGAADYILWPAREAEIIAVVERVLRQVHDRKEREGLAQKLQQTNVELQQRVRELTTIFSIGKAVTSVTEPVILFEKILDGSVKVCQADFGWFLLRDERSQKFLLVAQRNLPASMELPAVNQPWDDGISSLVAISGEPLMIHGDPIKRFKVSMLGQSVLIMPVKVQKQVIALLVLMRNLPRPFSESDQKVLQAVADYASISLVNARLFRTIEERAYQQQAAAENARSGEKIFAEILQKTQKELQQPLDIAYLSFKNLTDDPTARWTAIQRKQLSTLHEQIQVLQRVANSIEAPAIPPIEAARTCNLSEVIRKVNLQFQPFAQQNNLSLAVDLPPDPVTVVGDGTQVAQVISGLLSNAMKFCNSGGHVTVCLEKTKEGQAHVIVEDSGIGIDPRTTERIFTSPTSSEKTQPRRFGGLGISMKLIKEILTRQNGKIWIDTQVTQGARIHFTLPLTR